MISGFPLAGGRSEHGFGRARCIAAPPLREGHEGRSAWRPGCLVLVTAGRWSLGGRAASRQTIPMPRTWTTDMTSTRRRTHLVVGWWR